jgi:SAM-dependent methyltransferase
MSMWRYNIIPLAKGIVKSLPGMEHILHKRPGSTVNSRYCYAVWMRHLLNARENGMSRHPSSVVELGPGGTVGVGMAALLSGTEQYTGLDVVNNWQSERNIRVFDELLILFREREPIPGKGEFPKLHAPLPSLEFPSHILPDQWLRQSLAEERTRRIREALKRALDEEGEEALIRYIVPWARSKIIAPASVDLICSQAVLEHVEDPRKVYESMHLWLREDGMISHEIDFKSHASSGLWNGHWSYSDFQWKVVKGRYSYLINRLSCQAHLDLMKEVGFQVIRSTLASRESQLKRANLAPRFRDLTDKELSTPAMFFQAKKEQVS